MEKHNKNKKNLEKTKLFNIEIILLFLTIYVFHLSSQENSI